MQTFAPWAAKASAFAAPMPRAAPVIRIFLPFRRLGSMMSPPQSHCPVWSHERIGPLLGPAQSVLRGRDPAQHVVKFFTADPDDIADLGDGRARPELKLVAPGHG